MGNFNIIIYYNLIRNHISGAKFVVKLLNKIDLSEGLNKLCTKLYV